MKISDLISRLERILDEYGDLPSYIPDDYFHKLDPIQPEVELVRGKLVLLLASVKATNAPDYH
ncbi:hypothetical protein OKW41_006292 [Paraburkholderia sp. UCT70]|uniref:hypothetical protein n=1 Tax=Paraburkholderia sp. UCT70 TaxID=2991068 RepID=UPI003D204C9E